VTGIVLITVRSLQIARDIAQQVAVLRGGRTVTQFALRLGDHPCPLPRLVGHGFVLDDLVKQLDRWRLARRTLDQLTVRPGIGWPTLSSAPTVPAPSHHTHGEGPLARRSPAGARAQPTPSPRRPPELSSTSSTKRVGEWVLAR